MVQAMPPLVTLEPVLVAWKEEWQSLSPFFLGRLFAVECLA